MTEASMLEEIVKAVRRRVPATHYRVILFGSRAEGRAREGSDYDIAIDAGGDVPFGALALLEGDLEDLPTLAKVDVVDLHTANSGVARSARSGGKAVFEQ